MVLKIILAVARFLLRVIATVELEGFDKIPRSGSCIVVTNHLGRLDAMLGMILTERDDIIMMVAEKYQKYTFWRFIVKQFDALWLDRNSADFRTLRIVQNRLKAGGILGMAPEGHRSPTEVLLPGKPGAAYLAAKTDVPILPVALWGTEDRVVKARLRRLQRLHIHIRVGDPFKLPPMDRRNRDEFLQKSTDEIMCRIAALLPEKYRGYYANHPRVRQLEQSQDEIGGLSVGFGSGD